MSSLGFVQHLAGLTLLDLSRTTVGDFTPVEACPSLRRLVIGGRQPMRLPSMCKLPGLQVGSHTCIGADLGIVWAAALVLGNFLARLCSVRPAGPRNTDPTGFRP